MKTRFQSPPWITLFLITVLLAGTQPCEAARRVRRASPGRAYVPPAAAAPAVTAPAVERPAVDRPPYVHTLPAGYERRVYRNRPYYYWDNTYYYEYPNEGEPIYVAAPVEDGEPTVPPRPFLETLPPGAEKRTFGNLSFYYSNGEYYYEFSNDGPTIYVPASVVNGLPKVPPRPFVYSLPQGYTTQTVGGVTYYAYYGVYYYVYYINGRAVYVLAPMVNGVPTVPPPPY